MRRGPNLALRGAMALAVIGLVLWSALSLRIPFIPRGGQVITAHLPSAANARPGQPVRVRGVDVGQIEDLRAAPGGGVLARLRVGDEIDVRADARVALRWRTIFGRNMAIELDPGSPSAPPLGDRAVPRSATAAQVEWDELFEPLDAPGRGALRTTMNEVAAALRDPAAPREAARLLAPTMRGVGAGLAPLRGTHPGDLTRLVRRTARTAAALGRSQDELAALLDDGVVTLGVTAARQADVGRLLDVGPRALSRTTVTLARLDRTLDALDPLVAELRPAAPRLAPAVAQTRPALRSLRITLRRMTPALDGLSGALAALETAERSATPMIRGLRPGVGRLEREIVPALDRRNPGSDLRLFQAVGPWFAAAASSVGEFDASGHMVRFQVNGGEATINPARCQLASAAQDGLCGLVGGLLRRLTRRAGR